MILNEASDSAASVVEDSPPSNGAPTATSTSTLTSTPLSDGATPTLDSSGGPLEAASPIDPSAAPLVDLRPFCDRTPYIVNELLPLRRVLRLFKAMPSPLPYSQSSLHAAYAS